MIRRILFSLLLISCCSVAVPLVAHAAPAPKATNLLGPGSDCGGSSGAGSSAVCTDTQAANPQSNPVADRLKKITAIIAFAAGAAAVLIMLVAGIQYITSDGDSNQISSAKQTIIYALIGLIVIVLAVSIIEFVLNKI
jgi:hypothetical protein